MKMYEEQEIVILLTEIRTINNTKELDTQGAEFLNKFEFCNGYAKGYCNATNCKECAGNNDDTLEWLKSEEISK